MSWLLDLEAGLPAPGRTLDLPAVKLQDEQLLDARYDRKCRILEVNTNTGESYQREVSVSTGADEQRAAA